VLPIPPELICLPEFTRGVENDHWRKVSRQSVFIAQHNLSTGFAVTDPYTLTGQLDQGFNTVPAIFRKPASGFINRVPHPDKIGHGYNAAIVSPVEAYEQRSQTSGNTVLPPIPKRPEHTREIIPASGNRSGRGYRCIPNSARS